jgi:hypothetical protein
MGRVTGAMLPFGYAYASLVWSPLPRCADRLVYVPGHFGSYFPSPHGVSQLLAPRSLFCRGSTSDDPNWLLCRSAGDGASSSSCLRKPLCLAGTSLRADYLALHGVASFTDKTRAWLSRLVELNCCDSSDSSYLNLFKSS